jgi:hypothetical protein
MDRLPAGPYRTVALPDGSQVPFYIIPFDKEGRCEGPETRRHLLKEAENGGYTHLFLFSHGWNNDWTVATRRYEDFLAGFMKMRREHQLPAPAGYKPLLVGVFWPSTALVFGESEKGPAIAAAPDPKAMDARIAEERAQVRELALNVPGEHVARFYELAQKSELDKAEALELARLLLGNAQSGNDEVGVSAPPSAEEVVKVAQAAAPKPKAAAGGRFGTATGTAGGPQAAGFLDKLDPRNILRAFTVWQMKDRAGTVGAHGVGPLLRDLLGATKASAQRATEASVHLVGHSYGAKIVLSALCHGAAPERKVESTLLLQPAVSHLCFAANVPGVNRPGGYRAALDRVAKPIFATFSKHDTALHDSFHLALRRGEDLGEARIAADGDEPPSKYAALGGYGPRGADERIVPVQDVGQRYDMNAGARIYGIKADRTISGHGDISNDSTYWALYCQSN